MARNSLMDIENRRLSMKVEEMKEICSQTSSINVKYRLQLEKEISEKDETRSANQSLKLKLNKLTAIGNEQNERIKVLETHLHRAMNNRSSLVPVKIISSISEIVKKDASDEAFNDLQQSYDELDVQHREALAMIDDLEFELGDIDHLEMEIQRLQQENTRLKEMLEQAGNYNNNRPESANTSHAVNYDADNFNHLTQKADSKEEEHDGMVNELKSIHARKQMLQQRLENFHLKPNAPNDGDHD